MGGLDAGGAPATRMSPLQRRAVWIRVRACLSGFRTIDGLDWTRASGTLRILACRKERFMPWINRRALALEQALS